jgi:hypothetical protein
MGQNGGGASHLRTIHGAVREIDFCGLKQWHDLQAATICLFVPVTTKLPTLRLGK